MTMRSALMLLIWTLYANSATARAAVTAEPLQQRLSAVSPQSLAAGGATIRAFVSLQRFYGDRGFLPAWTGADARPLLEQLMSAIAQSSTHGLTAADYHQAALRAALVAGDSDVVELLATDAYLTLAAHLVGGRLDPVTIEPDWTANKRERDLVRLLEQALAQRQIRASLEDLEPKAPGYRVLKEALAMYREAAKDGDWPAIAAGPALRLGDAGPRVATLRQRLRATGLLAEDGATGVFDVATQTAVAAFQRRVGLAADGVVGTQTLRELNKRPSDRIDQIRANLERWRWLPEDLGDRHVRVNIADYRLEARAAGRVERIHDVIVGRTYRKTPVFSSEISYVVLNPWWETPPSLARKDKLPTFRKDPASVKRLGFDVIGRDGHLLDPSDIDWSKYSVDNFPFRLRQRPGPQNALGQVKLMFPNRHSVYLHDTPSRELFTRTARAFSSGCVRVADVLGLTEWVLQGTADWPRNRIESVVAEGRETRVNLDAKVPIHILYFTAVSDADGSLRLISDIYQRDALLIAALGNAVPKPAAH